ncbi:hypothetical protein EYU68_23020 [Escherichia coli]|nr:hypothetical protein [Escherichia coli]EFB9738388.1 hypothetical protein [Escherichia coli]EFN4891794.1 hypothetical protein [Escherichia coli]
MYPFHPDHGLSDDADHQLEKLTHEQFNNTLTGSAIWTTITTQSIRAAATAGVLLCFVEKPTDLAGSI